VIDKIRKCLRRWTCVFCKFGIGDEEDNNSKAVRDLPKTCLGKECGKKIRSKTDFLVCTGCRGQWHKQESCSGLTRDTVKQLDRLTWKCDGCQGIDANPKQGADTKNPIFFGKSATHRDKLTILQWNADGIRPKVQPLRDYLQEKEIDVFLIQETKLVTRNETPKFKGYTVVREDRVQRKGCENDHGGGLIIGVKKDIPYRVSRTDFAGQDDEVSEWMSIEIPTKGNQKLRLNNIYIPPVRTSCMTANANKKTDITTTRWMCTEYDCLFGDFNAHSEIWDDRMAETASGADSRGELIENWVASTNMISINDGSPTRTNRSARNDNDDDTTPDISFVHSSLMDKFSWKVENELGSDHKPIIITYEESIPKVNETPRYKWNFKKADWKTYQKTTEEEARSVKGGTIKKMEKALRSIILKAANKHIGKKKVTESSKPWLTQEIKDEIQKRNALRATIGNNRKEFVETGRKVSEMVKAEKEKQWREYVEQLDMKTNPKQVWSTIRGMDGRCPPRKENQALVVGDKALIADRDKAEAFAKTYRGFSKLKARKEDRAMRRLNRKFLKKRTTCHQESEREIEMEELNRVIRDAGLGKAAGEDDIPYELIKNLGPIARGLILKIFNKIWAGNELPQAWIMAIIKPLLKDGKDPELTSSYRPISLTSCLGKLLEKIIADRLTFILESRGILSDNQAGFRQGRCTTDQILRLTQSATDQIHCCKGQNATLVTFFDYEKAYDKVWRDGLIYKMNGLGLPWKFTRYTRNFLSSRVTTVEVNNKKCKKFLLKEGLPQGSAISPLLFLVFINDIDAELSNDTLASLFADDTAIASSGGELEEITPRMQEEINKIVTWADTWKMSINTSKTKTLTISTSRNDTSAVLQLQANGKPIDQVTDYPFLGLVTDNGLRFTGHVDKIVRKGRKRVNILKCMASKDWGNALETQRTLYIQYVRSCMEYTSSAYAPWLPPTSIDRLEKVQNAAMRAIAGLAATCPIQFLRLETNLEPLQLRLEKSDVILWDRYRRLPDEDQRKKMILKDIPARSNLKTRHGWRIKTKMRALEFDVPVATESPMIPPWLTFPNLSIQSTPLEKKKDDYQPEELRTIALAKIDSIEAHIAIYTDGSTDGNQERGGAGIFIETASGEELLRQSAPAGMYCSSFGGECVALLLALEWVECMEKTWHHDHNIIICTDSKSLTDALDSGNWKDPDHWMRRIKHTLSNIISHITLLWIPSHVDIAGNEVADELANSGRDMDQSGVHVSQKIIKARIKRQKWTVTRPDAKLIYGDRLSPKMDVEKTWPRHVRSLFGRLRTGHAQQLRSYLHFIQAADDDLCEEGCEKTDTNVHALCECSATAAARQRHWDGEVVISMMVTHPEVARKILRSRFKGLFLPREIDKNTECSTASVGGCQ